MSVSFTWPVKAGINTECEVTPTELRRFTRTFESTAPNFGADVSIEEGAHYCSQKQPCEWCNAHGVTELHGTLDPSIVTVTLTLLDIYNPPLDVTMGPGPSAHTLSGLTTTAALDNLIEKLLYVREAARKAGAYPPEYAPQKSPARARTKARRG